jgi:uncharacterized protein YgiM (DUF1202 family)
VKRTLLQVLPLTLLLVALFSIFTISPVSAATQQHAVTASSKIAQDGTIVCYYKVTADPSLNVRDGHGLSYKIVGSLKEGTIVAAYSDSTYSQDGYVWRQLDDTDGNWVATNWLQKTSARCVS